MNSKTTVRQGYNKVSRRYRDDRGRGPDSKNMKDWLRWIDQRLPAGSRVLELGCGMGVPVAKHLAGKHDYLGVDISDVQVQRARRLVPEGRFKRADMSRFRFKVGVFDAVMAFYSIIHLPLGEQPPLLKRISRWLRPQGLFVAMLGHGRWTGREKNWFGAEMFWSHADGRTYRGWLDLAGFKIVRHDTVRESGGKGIHDLFYCVKKEK
ncbi:MAG TPA: class I SAM-dependent methyltransferase [bacterium]|nr:class I SAM-dependent methyltransferase [bacterium]